MANERQVKMTKRIMVRSINSDIRAFTVRPGGAGTVTLSVDDEDSGVDGERPLIGGMLQREDAIELARALLEAAGLGETPSRDVGTFYIVPRSV
jgi:hypothetical protein